MAIANIQAQITNLTSQLSQHIERTTMQSIPTFGASYMRGYEADWSNHSNSMWWEPQQVQHKAYWQPYEEFYSEPTPPPQQFQTNAGSSMNYDEILDELISLSQGTQNQAKEAQQEGYWQPYEEFYSMPMQPPQPSLQQFQTNSGSSMDYDHILDVLTTLAQGMQTQTKEMQNQTKELGKLQNEMGELKIQLGEIVDFMGHIQEQSEFSNSTTENSMGDVEITKTITLESGIEVGADLKTSPQSLNIDAQLLFEEEEEEKATAREEPPLPQPFRDPTPFNSGKVAPYAILSNPVPPNVPIPCRFNEEEGEKGIVKTFPTIQEKEVVGGCLELIKEDVLATTIPNEVEFYDTGQVITPKTPNLAEFSIPGTLLLNWCLSSCRSTQVSHPPPPPNFNFFSY